MIRRPLALVPRPALLLWLAVAALALILASHADAASPAAVGNELLRLDCGARLHLFPTGFMNASLDLSRLLKGSGTAELFTKKLKDRFKCMMDREQAGSSSQLTDPDWVTGWSFGPQALVNMLRTTARKGYALLPEAARKAMRKTYRGLPFFWNAFYNAEPPTQAWLPDTCSGNGPCYMTINARATFGAVFKVAYDFCPATSLPFVSVGCEGSACERFTRPCSTDGDCQTSASDTGAKCLNLFESPSQKQVFTFLKGLGMYDVEDKEDLVANVMRDLLDYYRSAVSYKFCLATAPRLGITASDKAELLYLNNKLFSNNFTIPKTGGLTDSFEAIYHYVTKDIMGCAADANGLTTCLQVSSWDGKLASGESVVSEARKQGRDIAYSGIRVVMDKKEPVTKLLAFDCEGELSFHMLPAWRTAAHFTAAHRRRPRRPHELRRLGARYLLSTFTNAPGKPPQPALTSYYANENVTLFDVRSTDCSLETIASKGYCLARIAKYFPKDLKVEAGLAQCHGEAAGLAAFEIGVSGTGAELFTIHQGCDTSAACGGTSVCENVEAPLEEFFGLPVGFIKLYDLVSNAFWGNGPLPAPQLDTIPFALNQIKIVDGPACLATASCKMNYRRNVFLQR
eukprot:tig00020830_g14464.t1